MRDNKHVLSKRHLPELHDLRYREKERDWICKNSLHYLWYEQKKDLDSVLTEHLRMSGAYWGLTAMDLMGHLSDMDDSIVNWVKQCQHESGKFIM